jgi:hypothetical protein
MLAGATLISDGSGNHQSRQHVRPWSKEVDQLGLRALGERHEAELERAHVAGDLDLSARSDLGLATAAEVPATQRGADEPAEAPVQPLAAAEVLQLGLDLDRVPATLILGLREADGQQPALGLRVRRFVVAGRT